MALLSSSHLAIAGQCGLSTSTSLWASRPASFPALVASMNEQSSHILQSQALVWRIQAAEAFSGTSRDGRVVAKAAEQTAVATIGGVTEVTKDTFWPILEAAGDKLVVLDLYTRWCGPCRLIYPKLVSLSEKYTDVIFLKLHCNPENKPLARKLGHGVVPTFKIFKNKIIVSDVKGAKLDELVQKIEKARAS